MRVFTVPVALAFVFGAWSAAPPTALAAGVERTLAGGPGEQESPALASDGAGGYYAAWVDRPSTLKVQRLRADGTPAWPDAFSLAGGDVTRILVVGTRAGAFVVWGTVGGGNTVRVQFVEAGGRGRWSVPTMLRDRIIHRAVSDGGSGVAVLAVHVSGYNELTLLDANGAVAARHGDIGARYLHGSTPPVDPDPVDVALVAPGELVVAWGGASLQARKIGRGAWGPVTIADAYGIKSPVRVVADGSGGAVVAWSDRRRGPREADVYARRVDASGRSLGPAGGTQLHRSEFTDSTDTNVHAHLQLEAAPDGSGGTIVAFAAQAKTASGHFVPRVHVQRMTGAGARAWPEIVRLDTGTDSSRLPSIVADGAGGAFVVHKTEPTGSGARSVDCLVAQRVGPDGSRMFGDSGERFGRCGSRSGNAVAEVGRDRVMVAWRDTRDAYADVVLWSASAPGARPPALPAGPASSFAVAPSAITRNLPKSAEILPGSGKPALPPPR